ncbi:MAG: ORF6N domain-containing protein [Clostridia bacterium]|nr:ORF6N domain-containing protein [Clostridia bacterium]
MEELVLKEAGVENLIYEIRGKQVMLDSDLARLYQCKNGTKTINLAVKRHLARFPERFMFQLTKDEYFSILRFQSVSLKLNNQDLRFQIETSNEQESKYGGRRYLPYAFTEQGVAMLATVLKTEVAEKVSIQIMDAFVSMRKYISSNLLEQKFINNQVMKNTEDIKLLQESFKKFEERKIVNEIYFNGQIYDAYSKILDITQEAKEELIIIDGYADKTVLDIARKLKCEVILITKTQSSISKIDISKYNSQYSNLKIVYDNSFHDRYFILDGDKVYHCGTSINHAGSRTFSINLLEDKIVKKSLIENINQIIYEYRL